MSQCEKLNCDFTDISMQYACVVTSLDNTMNEMVINGHSANHKSNKRDSDVLAILMYDTNTKHIPRNLGLLFYSLTTLVMLNTSLVEIKSQDFDGMMELEHLEISLNLLTSLPINTFSKLTKLRTINLSWNQINTIQNGVFSNNLNLESLFLYENNIKFLGSTLFDGLPMLNIVNLENNTCVTKKYEGSTEIIQLKNDIQNHCNDFYEKPTMETTQSPIIVQQIKINELEQELLNTKEQQQQNAIEMENLKADLIAAIRDHQDERDEVITLSGKNTNLELQFYGLNKEILELKELRQSDRIAIRETKKELLNLNEQRQKDHFEVDRVKNQLLEALKYQELQQLKISNLIDKKNQCEAIKIIAINSYNICSDQLGGELIS
ncbi:unnamed protein product [Diamesa serratosioi]